VVIEKPFGEDLQSACALNALLAKIRADAYRVDHVLSMETTRNLVAMRDDVVIERLWNSACVEQVEILWEETLALEGRARYYDRAGALKDVVQSHMVQLLAIVAIDAPMDGDVHRRKREVLESVRVATGCRRARYTAGRLADGRQVPAYADEEGVNPARNTETFAEVVLHVETPRWRGTRFVLRAGKALERRRKLVLLRFRGGGALEVGIDGPCDVVLSVHGENPLELRAALPGNGLPPYAHVLLDVLGGTSDFSIDGDEAEQAWRVLTPVLDAWEDDEIPLEEYPAGSVGPR
jgi:glucose-6-phosphate 1-dehydrogenase